jgi:tetratricopeptide (TPR) repeat protein
VDAAARALATLLPGYLQDVELPLQLGELMLRSGRLLDALYSYQLALTNSAPGGEAELGLGWTLVKLGRCPEARVHFQTVLATTPATSTAAEGLRQCGAPALTPSTPAPKSAPPPKLWLQPLVAQSFYLYQNHPTVSYVLAPTVRLEALLYGHYYGAVTYRYSYFATRNNQTAAWSQHDLYLDAGYSARAAGVTLHYALIADGSGSSGTTHHAGLTGRYSRGFDALLNLSASFFADTPVLRGELAWVLPIAGGFSARPAAAVQWTKTATFKTLALTLFYSHRVFALWLGGKFGDEQRAAYLNIGYVYNSLARVPYGAWAGAALRPGRKFTLTFNYSYDRLVRADATPPQDSPVHALTLGLAREF